MNENLNLVEILKDCPCGTKLYSTIRGDVEFEKIVENTNYPIQYKYRNKNNTILSDYISIDGKYSYYGECILFPSKDQRDWFKFKVEPEMVDGEIYYTRINLVEWIYIYRKNYTFKTMHYVAVLNNYLMVFNNICTTHNEDIKVLRKATEEEKRLFFEIIEKNGRKWDVIKKELVKIKPKFDINTLQPFDKVLTRDWDDSVWRCNIYEYFDKNHDYPFMTIRGSFKQTIPYNNETKYLVGTREMPPKEYITWEE